MALSNAERQARYRARLKQMAASGPSLGVALRRFLTEVPDELPDGASVDSEVAALLFDIERMRSRLSSVVDGWREFHPDADFSSLDAALNTPL